MDGRERLPKSLPLQIRCMTDRLMTAMTLGLDLDLKIIIILFKYQGACSGSRRRNRALSLTLGGIREGNLDR